MSGFPGKNVKPNTSIWSAPWLGDSSSTRCLACKGIGHNAQDCPKGNSFASEQKTMTGLSISPGASPKPPKNSKEVGPTDLDAHASAPGVKGEQLEKVSSGPVFQGLQIGIESVPGNSSLEPEKSKTLLPSPTPGDLVHRRSPSFKIHDSSSAASKVPSLLTSTSFQQLVTGQISSGVSSVANEDIPHRQGSKAESGCSNAKAQAGAYDTEGPPGVETAHVDYKTSAMQNSTSPAVKNEGILVLNASQISGPKGPQGHSNQPPEAIASVPAPPVLPRGSASTVWGPRPHWMVGLSAHAVQSPQTGHVHLPGQVPTFAPSGPVIYGQSAPVTYLASQPSQLLLSYASSTLPPGLSPTPPITPAALDDAAIPSADISWR